MPTVKLSLPEETWQKFRILCIRENIPVAQKVAAMVTDAVAKADNTGAK